MATIYTDITITMPTEKDYVIMKPIIKTFEEKIKGSYNDANYTVYYSGLLARIDLAVDFAQALDDTIIEFANMQETEEAKAILLNVSFVLEGNTDYDYDLYADCIIERKSRRLTIRERRYDCVLVYDDTYEEFCKRMIDSEGVKNIKEIVSEDNYKDHEYYVSGLGVYIDSKPDYSDPRPIESHIRDMETSTVTEEELASYLEENDLPSDDETLENLSVEDVYAIMGETYVKDEE